MVDENEKDFKILLVEDREEDIDITKEAIKETAINSEMVVARDGQKALDYLEDRRNDEEALPDLIFLDLNLPKVSGQEVLEHVKDNELLRRIPIIVLTISKRDEDIARSYDSGAAGYITKPVDYKEFLKSIEIVKKYWSICKKP